MAEEATTLYHPHIPDLTRERSDEDAIKEHLDAGWLRDDPQVAREAAAAEEAEHQKRSEAATKAAETRKKNAEQDQVGDGKVRVVDQTPQ